MPAKSIALPIRRAGVIALAVLLASSLSFPSLAFAVVRVDQTDLAQGENAVGGGTATLADSTLDMNDVTAGELYTDEDLSVNFNGGNEIEQVTVESSAEVELSFSGENEVEEVHAFDDSDVTINADGHNEFEEVHAFDSSNVTVNVTGENEFEEISGYDDANITVRGTTCQKKDIIELGEDEADTNITTNRGSLTIDHVTVNLEGEIAVIGSENGNVTIDTSKIGMEDGNEYTEVVAGGTMNVRESVIDIKGTVHSSGKMVIEHSDVKAEAPDPTYNDASPYRIYSETGIELIREKNGKVMQGALADTQVFFVDTGDGDSVNLKADGKPAYYTCSCDSSSLTKEMAKTGDATNPLHLAAIALAGAITAALAAIRRKASLQE